MRTAFLIKSLGYLISVVSVILLGVVSWESASRSPWLVLALAGGMAASVAGMAMRWASHYMAHRDELARQGSEQRK